MRFFGYNDRDALRYEFPRSFKPGDRVRLVRTAKAGHQFFNKVGTVQDHPDHEGRITVLFDGHATSGHSYWQQRFDLVPRLLRSDQIKRTRAGYKVSNVDVRPDRISATVHLEDRALNLNFDGHGVFVPGQECPVDLVGADT